MCVAVFWLNRFWTFSSKPHPLAIGEAELVRHQQVRARQHRRAAHVAAPVDHRRVRIQAHHLRGDRRAAAAVEEGAELRPEVELVGAIQLHDVRPVGGQRPARIEIAVRIPQQLVDVPAGVRVAARARDGAVLLLRVLRRDARRRRADLVGVRGAGVVAVEAAPGVVDAARTSSSRTAARTSPRGRRTAASASASRSSPWPDTTPA